MTDNEIIELFFNRKEQAINELDGKYGKACYSLSYSIVSNKRDAEECVSDAYLGVWNTIPPNRPKILKSFVLKIVRNISLSRYHENTAIKRNNAFDIPLHELEESLCTANITEEMILEDELTELINDFLSKLTKLNRVIFMRRYWFCDSYAEISDRVGVSTKNVSVRLTRIRNQLRVYLKNKGVII